MSNYGRNFEFRVMPFDGQREGRFALKAGTGPIPIGAPVLADAAHTENGLGLLEVDLATGAQAPKPGLSGIAVYEFGPAAYAGFDPLLTTYSDLGNVPKGAAVQVVHGDTVKVVFKNTVARQFLHTRDYAGRIMIAGLGATPTLAVGDFLTPGTGNDTDGYWAETGSATNAWLVVTKVDSARGEVEARMLF